MNENYERLRAILRAFTSTALLEKIRIQLKFNALYLRTSHVKV